MPSIPISNPDVEQILDRIRSRRGAAQGRSGYENPAYLSAEYEQDVNDVLLGLFPYSVLSGLRLYSAENRLRDELGIEIDNLLHFRHGGSDHIVIVEAKNQKLRVEGERWLATYSDGEKCAREQVDKHIRILWEYLEPISREIDLRFVAIVCCVNNTESKKANGYRNAELQLTSIDNLVGHLGSRFRLTQANSASRAEVLRVAQSGFLDLLRLGLPVPELGHPELSSAIRYVERCRRTLDESLFQDFKPATERWVINGSAGMGKSVLLAYTAAVLCSGRELSNFQGETWLRKADDTFQKIGFRADRNESTVGIMAMSAKQLDNIRGWFDLFVSKFQKGDTEGSVRFRLPEFALCRDASVVDRLARRCSALLVDEAHDLPAFAARAISKAYAEKGFYLVVACDRHQKLRLAGSDAKIIEGLDFSLKSIRLKQIYRNPAPIYIASLALMFRWFAADGPKVIPTAKELSDHFGFAVTHVPGNGISLSIMSDAHPANSWCHTVATFPTASAAFAALKRERVGHDEVLWIRFSEEDPDFDYEQILRTFTYHNCRSHEAHKITDKYVKGQEYSVVVIEGFPSFMDRFTGGENAKTQEDKMWAFRRELYLCASRATCFLFFICNVPESEEILQVKKEISNLISSLSIPKLSSSGGTRTWNFFINEPDPNDRRNLDVFVDLERPELETEEAQIVVQRAPEQTELRVEGEAESEQTDIVKSSEEILEVLPQDLQSDEKSPGKESGEQGSNGKQEPLRGADSVATAVPSDHLAAGSTDAPALSDVFKNKITVSGPMSVAQLARELGVQDREVIWHANRLVPSVTSGTVLDIGTIRKIAAKFAYGLHIASAP